jgi:hypothetical protein
MRLSSPDCNRRPKLTRKVPQILSTSMDSVAELPHVPSANRSRGKIGRLPSRSTQEPEASAGAFAGEPASSADDTASSTRSSQT